MSQSLFSWIHLSYPNHPHDLPNSSFPSQSLFSWIHLSYCIIPLITLHWIISLNPYFPGFIFLIHTHSLNPYFPGFIFLIDIESCPLRGQTRNRLNPYFPGFIFLIASSGLTSEMYCTVSQSLFSWIHLSYKGGDRMKRISVHPVSILIFLDSSFL